MQQLTINNTNNSWFWLPNEIFSINFNFSVILHEFLLTYLVKYLT